MTQPLFKQACFIGFGLIGASLAKSMRKHALAEKIVMSSRRESTRQKALEYKLADASFANAADAVRGSDLVILAMPVRATQAVLESIKDAISPNTIITDVGSTKGNVVNDANAVFGAQLPIGFVPAHPIAGSEKSGIDAVQDDLFLHRKTIVTPLPSSCASAVEKVTQLWKQVGSDVIVMDVEKHDDVLARTSHLPHLLAYNLVDQLAQGDDNLEYFRYAAGGFRDFTRIAGSDPTMWRDIFIANKEQVLAGIADFQKNLNTLAEVIEQENEEQMMGIFTRAQSARKHFDHILNNTAYIQTEKTSMSNQQFIVNPSTNFNGELVVPGDKSVSHRSIMFGSLAEGTTNISNFLEGEDALATLQAFRDMGVVIEGPTNGNVIVHGVGMNGLKKPAGVLYMGNSGTSMRLLSGILAPQQFNTVLTGDASLSKRPMERVAKPLRSMGANIQSTGEKGAPPLSINPTSAMQGFHYDMPVASAQVKSCLLLAGLWAQGTTSVTEPEVTRDHTERMLSAFGYDVQVEKGVDGNANATRVSVQGGGKLTATDIAVPSDISSATFFMVAAAIAKNADITLKAVGINPTRTGVIDILKLMGAKLELQNESFVGGEPVADIRVQSSDLKGINIPEHLVPLAIDEFPALFVAASCATGTTVLTGAKELRVKESDRIQVMADGLLQLGIDAQPTEDGMVIVGKGSTGNATPVFTGGEEVVIESHHDHRIAMSFAIAGLRAESAYTINGTQTVATSFPNFVELAGRAGLNLTQQQG